MARVADRMRNNCNLRRREFGALSGGLPAFQIKRPKYSFSAARADNRQSSARRIPHRQKTWPPQFEPLMPKPVYRRKSAELLRVRKYFSPAEPSALGPSTSLPARLVGSRANPAGDKLMS